jgi:hypothetical protein
MSCAKVVGVGGLPKGNRAELLEMGSVTSLVTCLRWPTASPLLSSTHNAMWHVIYSGTNRRVKTRSELPRKLPWLETRRIRRADMHARGSGMASGTLFFHMQDYEVLDQPYRTAHQGQSQSR